MPIGLNKFTKFADLTESKLHWAGRIWSVIKLGAGHHCKKMKRFTGPYTIAWLNGLCEFNSHFTISFLFY